MFYYLQEGNILFQVLLCDHDYLSVLQALG